MQYDPHTDWNLDASAQTLLWFDLVFSGVVGRQVW